MSSKERIIDYMRGSSKTGEIRVFIVCNGKETLHSVEQLNTSDSLDICVHCSDISQLELQTNPYRKKTREI